MSATAHTILYPATVIDMKTTVPRPIELLAPAKDAETAIQAILHGADAVYMGASSHGARHAAANSVADIARVAAFAHRYGARVYVTVNTIIYDDELADVERLVWDLWRAGADALIVQDMALLMMNLPPIALHASTQCDTRTPAKSRFLQDAGFSQIVLARELSLDEIGAIHRAVSVPLEVFVYGALCVSFSGDCQASFLTTGRSANRGECAQICRYAFDLEDGQGNRIAVGKHLLSLRDMNRIAMLSDLLAAGASSLKIEGRLKDVAYVKNATAAWRAALDRIISENPDKYSHASRGHSNVTFTPDLQRCFNRGYTPYFLKGTPRPGTMASFDTPKWVGQPVGTVVRCAGKVIEARLSTGVNNGDGLGYFDRDGRFAGFRVNRSEGSRLFVAQPVNIAAGTGLYRNNDIRFNALLTGETARRTVDAWLTLRRTPWGLALDARAEGMRGAVSITRTVEFSPAKTDQRAARRRVLEKTGNTIYTITGIDDHAGDIFIPASVLTAMRREVTELLDTAWACAYRRDMRRKPAENLHLPEGTELTRHDNIANRLAAGFYRSLGAMEIPQAIEVAPARDRITQTGSAETRVMECRYCLRREMGACLKTKDKGNLPRELYLVAGQNRFRLEFDCAKCLMRVWHINR